MHEQDVAELRERVALACRILGEMQLAKDATGHASARLPGTDRIFIRARGPGELGVRYTTTEQVVEVGLDGKLARPNDQGLEAPIEVFIHTSVYKARPDVCAVTHMHPASIVLFTATKKKLLPIYGAWDPSSAKLAMHDIPVFPRSILVSTPELGGELAATMGASNCCMMRGHGITTAGPNIEEAALTAIQLNTLAKMNYDAYLLGDPEPISDEEQAIFRSLEKKPDGKPGAPPVGRVAALWRYYAELTKAGR